MTGLLTFLSALRGLLYLLILARMIISFLPHADMRHPLVKFVYGATEPLLAPFRAILPSTRIGIDFSPLLLLLVMDMIIRIAENMLH
ncbi:MAG: YggT family protein [Candidatus Sericytochromatia bacterium]|jgi:YggT family protein|nr:YggT family protein [Candidatus Sericytochromatia bacterium]